MNPLDEEGPEEELRPEEYDVPERFTKDDPATIACPECGRDISEHADRCNHCGFYVPPSGRSRLPRWLFVAAILAILIALFWAFGGVVLRML